MASGAVNMTTGPVASSRLMDLKDLRSVIDGVTSDNMQRVVDTLISTEICADPEMVILVIFYRCIDSIESISLMIRMLRYIFGAENIAPSERVWPQQVLFSIFAIMGTAIYNIFMHGGDPDADRRRTNTVIMVAHMIVEHLMGPHVGVGIIKYLIGGRHVELLRAFMQIVEPRVPEMKAAPEGEAVLAMAQAFLVAVETYA